MASLPMKDLNDHLEDPPAYDKASRNDADYQKNSHANLLGSPTLNGDDREKEDEGGSPKITKILGILALTCSIAFFLNGYHNVVFNAPSEVIEQWINQSYCTRQRGAEACSRNSMLHDPVPDHEQQRSDTPRDDSYLAADGIMTEKRTRFIYSLATGAFSGGGAVGSALGGALAEVIGRRKALMATSVFMLISSPLMGLAGYLLNPELLIVGHFLVGCSVGAGSVISVMYIVEGSPCSIRGQIAMCTQLGNVAGFVSSQIVGLRVLLGGASRWPLLFLVTLFAPILQLALLCILPDSPRYLFITKGKKEDASDALRQLTGGEISRDLRDLEHEMQKEQSKPDKLTYWQFMTDPKYAKPLSVAIVMHLSMIWCGIAAIIAYSSILLREAGLAEQAPYANLAGGALYIIMTFVVVKLIDNFGRKTLHLAGLAGMIVFGLLTTLFSVLADDSSGATFVRIAGFISVLGFVVSYAVGPASVPWLIVGELFEQESRSMATSIVVPINWLSQLGVLILFPWLLGIIKGWTFLPFMCLTAVLFVYLLKYMPETKGLTFEQISAKFR